MCGASSRRGLTSKPLSHIITQVAGENGSDFPHTEENTMNRIMAAAILLAAGPCWAQKMLVPQDNKYPPSYWQVNYGVPQYGSSYNISIETQDIGKTEEEIKKLAAEYGAAAQQRDGYNQYQNGRPQNRSLGFSATEPNAESFAQKLAGVGRLRQYYMSSQANSNTYSEVKKKAVLLKAEIDGNKKDLEKFPIAYSIMNDLLDRCNNFLLAFDATKDKAFISVSLTEKRPGDQRPAGEN